MLTYCKQNKFFIIVQKMNIHSKVQNKAVAQNSVLF